MIQNEVRFEIEKYNLNLRTMIVRNIEQIGPSDNEYILCEAWNLLTVNIQCWPNLQQTVLPIFVLPCGFLKAIFVLLVYHILSIPVRGDLLNLVENAKMEYICQHFFG